MTSYEDRFEQFYKDEWSHDRDGVFQDLLLNVYPYSVEMTLPSRGRWLELGIGSGRVVDYNRRKNEPSCQIIGLDYLHSKFVKGIWIQPFLLYVGTSVTYLSNRNPST